MSKNKSKDKEMTPREMRLANYEAMQKKDPIVREQKTREEFRQYFVKLKRKLNLNASLEQIIWLHLKAAGFASKDRFDAGIKHFGYEI